MAISEKSILKIAAKRPFQVHKFRWGHSDMRKITRRMCKDGKLQMVECDRDYFYYRTPDEELPDIEPR